MDKYREAMKENRRRAEGMKAKAAEHNLSLADSLNVNDDGSLQLRYPESAKGSKFMKAGNLGLLEEGLSAVIDISPEGSDEVVPATISKITHVGRFVHIRVWEFAHPIAIPVDSEVRFIRRG